MAEPVQREQYNARQVPPDFAADLRRYLTLELQNLTRAIAPKRREAYGTQAPTVGPWTQGDVTWNLTPSELGAASSKYVITGWICTVTGTPGTWLQMHALTGN